MAAAPPAGAQTSHTPFMSSNKFSPSGLRFLLFMLAQLAIETKHFLSRECNCEEARNDCKVVSLQVHKGHKGGDAV